MGLAFPNALGLAAGFDRRGRLLYPASRTGFGSIEIGSLTWADCDFARAISTLRRLRTQPRPKLRTIVGVSLIKGSMTPWPDAPREFAAAMQAMHGLADYVALNPGRDRPTPDAWIDVVTRTIGPARRAAAAGARLPRIVVKIPARWISADDTIALAKRLMSSGADALLVSGEATLEGEHLALLARLRRAIGPAACLISVGGIDTAGDAIRRLRAGATLVQTHRAARRSRRLHWVRQVGASLARNARMREQVVLPGS